MMVPMLRLYLVDGTYELFRAFYGAPPRSDPDGREVGAVVAFVRSLLALIREGDATHLGCAFDHVIESFRNTLYEGYKTGEGVDPKLLAQFEPVEKAARACGCAVWPMVEFEADDAIAAAAARWRSHPQMERVVICSPDKDLAQCVVDGKVVCLNRRSGVTMDAAGVKAKFGVPPGSIPDWLALVGDSADGFPGVPGWGPKAASTLLSRYASIDSIPERAMDWDVSVRGAERLATALREHREAVNLYRRLATLRTDVDLGVELADLEWKGVPEAEFKELCDQLGEPDLIGAVPRWRAV